MLLPQTDLTEANFEVNSADSHFVISRILRKNLLQNTTEQIIPVTGTLKDLSSLKVFECDGIYHQLLTRLRNFEERRTPPVSLLQIAGGEKRT